MTILDKIRRSEELQSLFLELCDFEPSHEDIPKWLIVANGFLARPFGRDGAGGVFSFLTPPNGIAPMVAYCSSEGQAGSLGSSQEEFFSITGAVPHWRDCLKFSAGGSLAEMRRCEPLLANECRGEIEHYEKKRKKILELLELPILVDPVRSLHEAVSCSPSGVFSTPQDHFAFASLFNTHRWQG